MKGQVSLDYLAGAMVFFSAVIILVSSVMGAIPDFKESQRRSELELTAWAMSEVLLEDEGYWEAGNLNGTDWYTDTHRPFVKVFGLEGPDGQLSPRKIAALQETNYSDLSAVFQPGADFNIGFTEFVPVDTYSSFQPGSAPSYMTIDPADLTDVPVHYGSERFGDATRNMLLIDELGWYNKLMVSEDWDFTDADARTYNLTRTQFIPIAGRTYQAEAAQTEISDGKMLILRRGRGRVGEVPPQDVGEVASIQRYGVVEDDRIIRMVVQLWK